MVSPATEFEVVERSRAAVGPVAPVVRVAPARRAIASGSNAAAVAHDEGTPQRRCHRAGRAADVERLRRSVRDDSGDAGVARDPAQGLGRQTTRTCGFGPHSPYQLRPGASLEHLDVDDTRDARPMRATRTGARAPEPMLRRRAPSASARRWAVERPSPTVGGSMARSSAVRTIAPDSASRSPSIATIPSRRSDTCRRRRSCRASAAAAPPSPSSASVNVDSIDRNSRASTRRATSISGASTSCIARRAFACRHRPRRAWCRSISPAANACTVSGRCFEPSRQAHRRGQRCRGSSGPDGGGTRPPTGTPRRARRRCGRTPQRRAIVGTRAARTAWSDAARRPWPRSHASLSIAASSSSNWIEHMFVS